MIQQEQIFEYLDFMAQMIPVPFYWLDLHGTFIGINDKGIAAIGAPSKEYVIGKTVHELYNNDAIADILKKDVEQVINTGKASQVEDKVIDVSTGQIKYFMASREPLFNSNGNIIGVIGISIDITDRKEKERLEAKNQAHMSRLLVQQLEYRQISAPVAHNIYSQIAEHPKQINTKISPNILEGKIPQIFQDLERLAPYIPSPLYWLDTNIKVIGANESCLVAIGRAASLDLVVGKSSLDVIIGKSFYEFHPKEVAEELVATTKLVIATGKSIKVEEFVIDFATGKDRYFETIKTPLFDDDKTVIGVLCTAVDVTAEKEREHLKIEIQKSEQEAFRKISAQVAHDIGSPLAALQMVIPYCDILPENTRNVLSKSATRIADIAENFLSQFKPQDELNTQENKRMPTLIAAEILELLTEKKYEYSKLPVDITSNISNSGAFAFIDVDTRAFKRMLSNLINNAVDALEENIGEINLSLDSKDNQVQIIVTDNGKGMPESVKSKILNNIAITEGKTDGHGIGFIQIRETLLNNDGKFDIESKDGSGTKIILTFPKIDTPDWIAESIEISNDDLVVILDDDDSIHGAWETRFEKSAPNIKRKHFKQGDEAVVYIKSLSAEDKQRVFLLTDYELLRQGLHGLDVIEQSGIKRSILVTSHHNNLIIRDKAKQTNTKILPKPLASVVLINNFTENINLTYRKNYSVKSKNVSSNIPKIFEDLERLAPIIPIPIYWFDLEHRFLGLNDLSVEAIGGQSRKHITGKSIYELGYPFEMADNIAQHNIKVIETGQTLYNEDVIKNAKTGDIRYFTATRSPLHNEIGEVIGIVGTSLEITDRIERERLEKENQAHIAHALEQQLEFRKISAQVAHDIGSPLAALQMVIPYCDILPENTRNVLNKSAIRIADIAENFLSQFKPQEEADIIEAKRTPTLISAEILELLTEKKYEYSKLSVDITSNISNSGAFAFIDVDTRAFKRMLSNLINNAVDALDGKLGEVTLSLDTTDSQVQIIVTDNGKGMPESVKNKILNNIVITEGKTSGHGIGFTQIRDTLLNNDGKFDIESKDGSGTKIILTFPKIDNPDWMAESIEISNDDLVVILDDDDSIHGAWETRFEKSAPNIKRKHFKYGNEAIAYINNLSLVDKQKVFLLTDFELLHQNINGLDVIKNTNIKRSILVTSHHNVQTVRENAKLTNTRILPKALASVVPINILYKTEQSIQVRSVEKITTVIKVKPKIFEQLEFFASIVPTPFYWADTNCVVVGVNKIGTDLVKNIFIDDSLIGKTAYDIYGPGSAKLVEEHSQQVMRAKKPMLFKEELVDLAGGKPRQFLSVRAPLIEDGVVVGLVGTRIELTDSKENMRLESEHQAMLLRLQDTNNNQVDLSKVLRYDKDRNSMTSKEIDNAKYIQPDVDIEFIVSHGPGYVYWKNIDSVYIGCNQNFATLIGLEKPSDIVGLHESRMPWAKTFPSTVSHNINADKQVMLNRKKVITEECLGILNEKGLLVTLRSEKLPLVDKNGVVVGILGVSVDIADTKEQEQLKLENQAKIYQARIEEQEKFRKISAQVAHDIGSPLAALQMVIPHCNSLPENTRNVLSKSATRIADIAENFLSQFKPQEEVDITESKRTPTLISADILELLTEKKYEYSKLPIDVLLNISQSGYFAFINIDTRSFKRMLSNLINNAVDALEENIGKIILDVSIINDDKVQILVEDNGKGMPEYVKDKILNNITITEGKTDGHGIGFTQIRETLNNNDGTLSIESQQNLGTKIILTFPKIDTPDWMAESIELGTNDLVVILDDDEAIHGAWETRFDKSAPNIKRKHFKQGDEAVEYINSLSSEDKQRVFLLTDYELLRQGLHGLDVIEQTGIKRSILVTSHHNNLIIRDKAKQTNTKILPKPLASEVQININQSSNMTNDTEQREVDLVILDDDVELVEMILMYVVQESNQVDKYHKPQDLLNSLAQYPKTTQFLIDNQYKGENITGLDIVKQLYASGFSNLYLFTNEVFEDRSVIPEYVQIIAKDDLKSVSSLLTCNKYREILK